MNADMPYKTKENYFYMRLRAFILPVVNASNICFLFNYIFRHTISILKSNLIGIGCVAIGLSFQIITLPVEINASRRAKKEIINLELAKKRRNITSKHRFNCSS